MKILYLAIIISSALALTGSIATLLYFETNITTIQFSNNPREIAINPKTNRMYVVADHSYDSNSTLYVLGDTMFGYKTLDSVPTGMGSIGVAVNTKTNRVYVTNPFSNSVTIIDGNTDTVIDTVRAGAKPVEVTVNPVTNLIYVSNWDSPFGVTVINGSTDKIVASITKVPGASYGIAVDPIDNRIYVSNSVYARYSPNVLSVIDGNTNNVIANVTIAIELHAGVSTVPDAFRELHVTVDPATGMVYATNHWLPKISIIQGSELVHELSQSSYPLAVAVNSETNRIYTCDGRSISVYDGYMYKEIKTVKLSGSGCELALDPVNDRLIVSQSGQISVINNIDSKLSWDSK